MSETLLAIINNLNAPFWSAGNEDRLVLPFCVASGRPFWPPSPISPFITAGPVEWRPVEPTGTVLSVVVYRRAFQKKFEPLTPYGAGLIELDAGPRLMAYVPDIDRPLAVRADDRAGLHFARVLRGGPVVPILLRLT